MRPVAMPTVSISQKKEEKNARSKTGEYSASQQKPRVGHPVSSVTQSTTCRQWVCFEVGVSVPECLQLLRLFDWFDAILVALRLQIVCPRNRTPTQIQQTMWLMVTQWVRGFGTAPDLVWISDWNACEAEWYTRSKIATLFYLHGVPLVQSECSATTQCGIVINSFPFLRHGRRRLLLWLTAIWGILWTLQRLRLGGRHCLKSGGCSLVDLSGAYERSWRNYKRAWIIDARIALLAEAPLESDADVGGHENTGSPLCVLVLPFVSSAPRLHLLPRPGGLSG